MKCTLKYIIGCAVLHTWALSTGRIDSGKLSSISLVPVHRQPGWKCAETYIIWAVNEIITRKRKFAALFQKSPFAIKKITCFRRIRQFKRVILESASLNFGPLKVFNCQTPDSVETCFWNVVVTFVLRCSEWARLLNAVLMLAAG